MSMRLLEAEAAILSIPTVFDEQTARDVLERCRNLLEPATETSSIDALHALRLAGVLEGWNGLLRVAAPIRDDLRARMAAEAPDTYREASGLFADHAANGFSDSLAAALGRQPAAINKAVLRVMAAGPKGAAGPLDELIRLAAFPGIEGRRADGLIAVRQLESLPNQPFGVDRTVQFLRGLDAWRIGDRRAASELFTRVVARPSGDRTEAISRHLLGVHKAAEGQLEEALEFLTAAVALLRTHGDSHGLVQTLTSLGRALRRAALSGSSSAGPLTPTKDNQLIDAGSVLDEAVKLGVELGDPVLEGLALLELAQVEQDYGSLDTAIELAEEARGLLDRPEHLISALVLLGSLYRDARMDAEASDVLGAAAGLATTRGLGDRSLARILNVQASTDRRAGRTEDAIKRARESLELGNLRGDRKHAAHAMHTLAAALLDDGSPAAHEEAKSLLAASDAILEEIKDLRGREKVANTQARLASAQPKQAPSQD